MKLFEINKTTTKDNAQCIDCGVKSTNCVRGRVEECSRRELWEDFSEEPHSESFQKAEGLGLGGEEVAVQSLPP